MNVLITGGAGYIGSHVAKQLIEKTDGSNITIIDNLSTGLKDTVKALENIHKKLGRQSRFEFIKTDLKEFNNIGNIFESHNFDAVIHFAGSIIVPESVEKPLQYYLNNTVNSANLINLCIKHKIKKFIFSSTAAVYGIPEDMPVGESAPVNPINPYGKSKLMIEEMLKDAAKAHEDFKYVIFRYFNVAGADLSGRIGQSTPNATHLIKIASQTVIGRKDKMHVFGADYKTPDGTGIRDYIHIEDLANVHVKALGYLDNNESGIFNCGYGHGYSVLEVINAMKKVSGVNFNVKIAPRRAGDPPILISDNMKIKDKMNWQPEYDDLELICRSALDWEEKL